MARTRRFVGRDDELGRAQQALVAGAAGTICLAGPAGIGKTTLAEELMSAAAEGGRSVAWSRCWDDSSTPALWPWLQVLDALDPSRGHPLRSTVTGDDRFALFDRVAEWLRDRGRAAPTTIVIDDMHWADAASVELLHFLSRDVNNTNLHLIATYREEGRPTAIENRLADIEREATVVRLDGFDLAALRSLVDEGGVRSDATIAMLHSRSEGNPFFALELARLVDQAGDVDPDTLPVTHGVRSVIDRHLTSISRPTRDALSLAAFQGRIFDLRVLAVARQLDPLEITEMLTEAERAGLTRTNPDGQWQFEHALIAETLLAELGPHERAQGHLATADGLEKVHNADVDEHIEAIANHLLQAGSLVPPARLLEVSMAAARHAGRNLAWEDESHHLASAIHALRSMAEPDDALLVRTLIERMEVEKRLRDLGRAHDLGIEAAAIARRTNDLTGLAEVAIAFPPDSEGIEIDDISDPDQRPLREEALAALDAGDIALRCRLEAALALSLYWETPTGNRAESHHLSAGRREELTASALATARELGDSAILAHALNARIHATWGPEHRDERPRLAEELISAAIELDDPELALRGRIWRVAELFERGEFAAVDREIDAFEREAQRIRSRLHLWTVARWRANRAFMAGDLDRAEALAADALDLGSRIMDPEVAFHFYTTTLGPLQYLRSELADSIDYVRSAAASMPNVPAWRVGLAAAAAESGDLDLARQELQAVAADDFALLPRDLNYLGTMMLMALATHHVGDAAAARQVHEVLAPLAGRLAIHGTGYASYGAIDIALGQTAATMGHPGEAADHFRAAIELLDPTGSPYAGIARVHLAALAGVDDHDAAALLGEAAAIFDRTGLTVRAAAARADQERHRSKLVVRLHRDGGRWTLARAGDVGHDLGTLKGFAALRELVSHPGTDLHALTLAAAIEGRPTDAVVVGAGDTLLDDEARRAYRDRLTAIATELDDADRRGDAAMSAALSEEADAIEAELTAATGFGGRATRVTTDADRARVNVTKHLKRAIGRIADVDAELGRHLTESIQTGMTAVYRPGPPPVRWLTDPGPG